MIIDVRGLEYEATPENSAIFTGSTLLNGIYTDLDDDYIFIPERLESYDNVVETAKQEGIPVYAMDTYDPEAEPFCFMINALCRVFRDEIDVATIE